MASLNSAERSSNSLEEGPLAGDCSLLDGVRFLRRPGFFRAPVPLEGDTLVGRLFFDNFGFRPFVFLMDIAFKEHLKRYRVSFRLRPEIAALMVCGDL